MPRFKRPSQRPLRRCCCNQPCDREGLHGVRDAHGLNCTLFPQTTAMAATGDPMLWQAMGDVMGREARVANNLVKQDGTYAPGTLRNRGNGLIV